MFTIPAKDTKRFSQPNYGDTQGNLWASFNLNLTKNTGRIRTTRCENTYNENNDTDLGVNCAFAFYDPTTGGDPVFVAYNENLFFGGTEPTDTFTIDALTDTPAATSSREDLKVFNDRLYATESTALKRLDHGDAAWTTVDTLTTGSIHQMCAYGDRLYYISDKNFINSIDTAETPANTGSFTMDLSYFGGHISWIKEGSNRIWIGYTKNDGTRGLIFEWDGQSENLWSKNYLIEAQGSAGCTIWNDVPYVLDIEGRLLGFNGANFEEVARLPILQYDVLNSGYATTSANKIIHFNGIRYMNDAIYMLVSNKTTGDSRAQESFPAGLYVYTKENGLTHAYSPSLTEIGGDIKDFGVEYLNSTGAIFDATARVSNASNFDASIMFGANIDDETDAGINAIFIDEIIPTQAQSGYLVTPWLESNQVTDVWNKIILKYRKFLGDNAKIVVKYRTVKDIPVVFQNIVWDSATAFTGTSAGLANIAVGDEIEVLTGHGAGKVAHVLTNTFATPNYTLTFDDSFPGVATGDISDIRFQTWKKLPPITATYEQSAELTVPQYNKDTQIQFKVVMEWENADNELREMLVINNAEQHAK